jgi:hypothetical protein
MCMKCDEWSGGGMEYATHLKCVARKGLWVRVPPGLQKK